ncbi:MAG: MBL fold metallo-hydrolase [Treponema sp.]|nr:MBL fold metallo-hydrolase [Treponema sp.]
MRIKWYGTASIFLEKDGTQIIFDPFIPLNKKLFKPPVDELAAAAGIFVTHGHFDHIACIPSIIKSGSGKNTVYCTAKPQETLISMGVEKEKIQKIAPGDILSLDPFRISVLKGRHIIFDKWLIVKTLFNPRMLIYMNNFRRILKYTKTCDEAGETVVYEIKAGDKRILLLGSFNLDDDTEYPKGADLLILPFQGRSDICKYAIPFIERLKPKKLMLDHFDDAFPPVSSSVKYKRFLSSMKKMYPGIPVISPQAGPQWIDVF